MTEEEFDSVGISGLQNPTIDDFRILNIDAEISNTKKVNNIQPLKLKVGWQTRSGDSIEKTYSVSEQLLAEKIEVSE